VDLSDENITELKLSEQLTNENEYQAQKDEVAVGATAKMAENNTGEDIVRISYF
jgi:hypothetical protein